MESRDWSSDVCSSDLSLNTSCHFPLCSAAELNGKWQAVFKDPVTDAERHSKHGRPALVEAEPGKFRTMENVQGAELKNGDRLVTVFENGKILVNYDLNSVRQRAEVLLGLPQGAAC